MAWPRVVWIAACIGTRSALGSSGVERAVAWLGPASWGVALVSVGSIAVLPGPQAGTPFRSALVVALAVFFLLLFARLVLAAARYPARRLSLLFLATAVGLWAAGSATVSASQTLTAVVFPAPGEALCLLSYLGMAAFLLLEVRSWSVPTVAIWLEAGVVCCSVICLAAFAVLTPLAETFSRGGLQLLLAVLYPLIDLVLGTLVVAQVMLRERAWSRRTVGLLAGFLLLAVADTNFIVSLKSDSYSANVLLDIAWGVAFGLIVGSACMRPVTAGTRRVERSTSGVLMLAAGLAVGVLVLGTDGLISWCVTVPAIITLACAGARMSLALHDARGVVEANRLSRTDELTGLPNRRALLAVGDQLLKEGTPHGLLLLDLDGFKDVNDSLGHGVGDEVLVSLAHRMRIALERELFVARLGGDEFGVLVPGAEELRLFDVAERVRAALREPLRVDGIVVSIDASVGIAVCEAGDGSSIELLRRADIAMYEAKQTRVGVLLFDPSQDGFSRQRLSQGAALRQAITHDELVVWYQPQVDARTRQVVALEALVRWRHPTEGLLSPIAFLPDVRRSGLMLALTEVVMTRVLIDLRRWADAGLTLRVAMNCAPPELIGGEFLPQLFAALDAARLPQDSLLVEVTEDCLLADPERAREALAELRAHGIQTSIDDYGTGFSSLAYLRDLPVDELKMDRSFVSTMVADERSRMIVQTTTQMAHALGLRLVAEGVEDGVTVAELVPLGVDLLQGYHIARPMPGDEVESWVQRWVARTTTPVHLP